MHCNSIFPFWNAVKGEGRRKTSPVRPGNGARHIAEKRECRVFMVAYPFLKLGLERKEEEVEEGDVCFFSPSIMSVMTGADSAEEAEFRFKYVCSGPFR